MTIAKTLTHITQELRVKWLGNSAVGQLAAFRMTGNLDWMMPDPLSLPPSLVYTPISSIKSAGSKGAHHRLDSPQRLVTALLLMYSRTDLIASAGVKTV